MNLARRWPPRRLVGLLGLLPLLALPACAAEDTRRSGAADMGPALRAMQDDDAQNPAGLWVQDGLALWGARPREGAPSCADCHGPWPDTRLRDVATRYPAWDETRRAPVTLAQRVDGCRRRHQGQPGADADAAPLLALQALLGRGARGRPIAPPDDARLAPYRARGAALWGQRLGLLDLSCAQCHDERAGRSLGGATIPQGHATGYPSYRLQWQGLGSLQRRLRNCLVGVRAQPFAPDAPQWVELELHLMQRAAGMAMDAPSVRP